MTSLNNTKETLQKVLGSLEKSSKIEKLVLKDNDFTPMSTIKKGEWLDCYYEAGQGFDEYQNYNKVTSKKKYIYIFQFGEFDSKAPSMDLIIQYIQAFYYGMEVKLLQREVGMVDITSRINPYTKKIQLKTKDLTDILKYILPEDAYCLIGVTMLDLYPSESWNFVFGEASLKNRVGVFSFARYDPDFLGEKNPKRTKLERSCEVCVHEIGHMFGIEHCIYYHCVMNGSNSLQESDSRTIELCPVCLRKLQKVVGFDYMERYKKLEEFMIKNNFNDKNWLKNRILEINKALENEENKKI